MLTTIRMTWSTATSAMDQYTPFPSSWLAKVRSVLLLSMTAAWCGFASAQLPNNDPDWKESVVPAAPAFDIQRLIPFDVSAITALRWGFDPNTVTISGDSLVRYVVVAQSSSGGLNAMYEAVRCATGEWKTYARYNKDSGWTPVSDPQWKSMYEYQPSKHALILAKQGLCQGAAPVSTVSELVRNVRAAGKVQ